MNLDEHRRALIERCRHTEGVTSLVFFGSAAQTSADRRDEWSDLDFNLFLAPEAASDLRAGWPFLPDRHQVVLEARDNGDGGVVLYADGTVYEFGAGRPWQIRDPHREVVLDGGDLEFGEPPAPGDPANDVRLFLAKLYLGAGRVRRGETLSGGTLIRTFALTSLCAALRARLTPAGPDEPSPFDPLRRFEQAFPEVGERLDAAIDQPAEAAARTLFALARELLEPGWPKFPTVAADLIAARFGWPGRR